MKFPPFLSVLILASGLAAQGTPFEGGGRISLAGTSYRFVPTGLGLAKAKGGLSGAIQLKGNLLPESGGAPFQIEMVVLKDGRLYLLNIHRGGRNRYPDTWAATIRTQVKAVSLSERSGGRIELELQGPLTGVVGQKPVTGDWQGRIWVGVP